MTRKTSRLKVLSRCIGRDAHSVRGAAVCDDREYLVVLVVDLLVALIHKCVFSVLESPTASSCH